MKKKVQIVILSKNPEKGLDVLLFKTNKERGSFWQNVTGSVDNEENFSEAAYRELIEETGIVTEEAKKYMRDLEVEFFFFDRKERNTQEKVFFYLGPKWDIQMCEEHTDFEWVSTSKIKYNRYKYPSNFQALERALQKIEDQKLNV